MHPWSRGLPYAPSKETDRQLIQNHQSHYFPFTLKSILPCDPRGLQSPGPRTTDDARSWLWPQGTRALARRLARSPRRTRAHQVQAAPGGWVWGSQGCLPGPRVSGQLLPTDTLCGPTRWGKLPSCISLPLGMTFGVPGPARSHVLYKPNKPTAKSVTRPAPRPLPAHGGRLTVLDNAHLS